MLGKEQLWVESEFDPKFAMGFQGLKVNVVPMIIPDSKV